MSAAKRTLVAITAALAVSMALTVIVGGSAGARTATADLATRAAADVSINLDLESWWDGGRPGRTGKDTDEYHYGALLEELSHGAGKTLLPLNASMATYFTTKTDDTGTLIYLLRKPKAPKLPRLYWTLPWFNIGFTTTENINGSNVTVEHRAAFEKPTAAIRIVKRRVAQYLGVTRRSHSVIFEPDRVFAGMTGVDPATVRIKVQRSSKIYRRFKVSQFITKDSASPSWLHSVDLFLRDGRRMPRKTSFTYVIVGRDRAGARVRSAKELVNLIPGRYGYVG